MKKQSLLLLSFLVVGLIVFSACPNPAKVLFYQENGNFIVDNNYVLKTSAKMSDEDLIEIMSIDTAMYAKTQGKAILVGTNAIRNVLNVRVFDKKNVFQQIKWLDNSQIFRVIRWGCFERRDIDWGQFAEYKNRLDGIFTKYKAVDLDGIYSIRGDHIATEAVKLSATDVSALSALTVKGFDDYTVCDETGGARAYRHILINQVRQPYNLEALRKVEKILVNYQNVR